ncbi:MAG: alpha/beta hydrolase [Acidimicrobiia bacterium]|jgi:pimeloyl-ACP methyl ester carboxylesterase
MSLQAPPKQDSPSRLVARLLVLLILAAAAGVVIYAAVTNQRVDLTEDVRLAGIELDDPSTVDDMRINVGEEDSGDLPVVFLHDVDVAGGMILESVSESLGDRYRGVRIDLPGFGFSTRMPFETPRHTAARMAETVSLVLADRFDIPVLVVGVGFGGEVAADLALTYPDQVSGLVMVDVDLDEPDSTRLFLERLPWMGKAATYTWETGGRFALDSWAPYCEQGGWCPSPEQQGRRAAVISIEETTESLHWFRRTPAAALAPANLEDIEVPVAYVWSTEGSIERDSVERIGDDISGMTLVTSDTFQAHLEDFDAISSALGAVDSGT